MGESTGRGRWWAVGLGGLILVAATWYVYRPSQGHAPRADNWWFWMHTLEQDDFWSILARSYSYNRTSTIAPGDYALFRPVLFGLLSLEKALFGTHFVWWQRAGVGLHLLVVGLLWALLARLIRLRHADAPRGRRVVLHLLAFALALFFAVNFAIVEMVAWSHINGYILFVVFNLGAMLAALDLLERDDLSATGQRLRLAVCFVLLLAGAFTYELGQFFALIVGGVLAVHAWRAGRRRQAVSRLALFAGVALLYVAGDRVDRMAHPHAHRDVDFHDVMNGFSVDATRENTTRYLLYTTVQPFVPSGARWAFTGLSWSLRARLIFSEPGTAWPQFLEWSGLLVVSAAVGLLLVGRTGAAVASARRSEAGRWLFLLLPASLFAMHLGITVLGRLNLRPEPGTLTSATYYSYLPLLMLLIVLFSAWTAAPAPRLASGFELGLTGGLCVLAVGGAGIGETINSTMKDYLRPFRLQVQAMTELVDQHRHDPAFRFALAPELFHACETFQGVPFPLILFGRFIDHDQPTHVVALRGHKLKVEPIAEYARRDDVARLRQLPTLARVGVPYNVFRCRGSYHGLPHWDGYYRPDRNDFHYLIQGDSIEAVLAQVPAREAEQISHLQSGVLIPPHCEIHRLSEADRGYALFVAGDFVYAIPEGEGPLDSARLLAGLYSSWYCGTTLEDIQHQIDRDGLRR